MKSHIYNYGLTAILNEPYQMLLSPEQVTESCVHIGKQA